MDREKSRQLNGNAPLGPEASNLAAEAPGESYGRRLGALQDRKSARAVEKLLRRAVLAACRAEQPELERALSGDPLACRRLEERHADWYIPSAMASIADLLQSVQERRRSAQSPAAAPLILTTNFDPLLDVALKARGVPCAATNIVNDQWPEDNPMEVAIWRLHGHWSGVTLHTPGALDPERRPRLARALERRLENADICVIGYGGWQDVLFATVGEMLKAGSLRSRPEVVWAFHESKPAELKRSYGHVFDNFASALGACRSSFYAAVDAHRDLSEVSSAFRPVVAVSAPAVAAPAAPSTFPRELRDLLAELREATPPLMRSALDPFSPSETWPNLCDVVLVVCNLLARVSPSERSAFAAAARALIERWCLLLTHGLLPALPAAAGKVLSPGVKTLLFVEILLARERPQRQIVLESGPRGAAGARARRLPAALDWGPSPDDAVARFKELLWGWLFRTEGPYVDARDWPTLRSHLQTAGDLGEEVYVVLEAEAREDRYDALARHVPQVPFVRLENGESYLRGVDEHRLAALVGEFLKRAFPRS